MSIARERILFQDEHYLAVHKLAGELVVRGKGPLGKLPLLDFLRKEFPGIRPVNRLDFETSGIVLFARSKGALEAFMPAKSSGEKRDLQIEKTYRTIVAGRMPRDRGEIRTPLPARTGKASVPAHTHFRVLQHFQECTDVEASFQTGRHHQIRRHLASIGHPLALDSVYGNQKWNNAFTKTYKYHRFFLHASRLSFLHPFTGKKVVIEAKLPPAYVEVLQQLRIAK